MSDGSSHPLSLVTGANRGIGLELAARLAEQGPVVGTSRSSDLPTADGIRWETLDVTSPDSQTALADRLGGAPVGLLVCNAGVFLDKGHALDTGYPAQMWADSFATNVTGAFLTVQSLMPNLKAAANARIVLISSIMASSENAPGGAFIYRASKAAVLNMGRNLAMDLASEGISVGIYHPGWVRTDMGGSGADISVAQAAEGLLARIAALGPETSGSFESYDGTPIPF